MRTACPSLRKSFPITSNQTQSPPITSNHPPITSKFVDQSPSNHLSCFTHNHARSHCSNRRRSAFNDQSMWESSYFFTWGVAIMMMMMITIMAVVVDLRVILPSVCDVCLHFCSNHSPITSKFAVQSPSHHLSCFTHNHARSHFSRTTFAITIPSFKQGRLR